MMDKLHPGDPVLYTVEKCSAHPGPRAQMLSNAPHGEMYHYEVDKFWRVKELLTDGRVKVYTRRGKERLLNESDPRLRKPGLIERFIYRHRFPAPVDGEAA